MQLKSSALKTLMLFAFTILAGYASGQSVPVADSTLNYQIQVVKRKKISAVELKGQMLYFDSLKNAYLTNPKILAYNSFKQQIEEELSSGSIALVSKQYEKIYKANKYSDSLYILNRYGNVSVNTWNKNEIKIVTEVKVFAKEIDDANSFINVINISDSRIKGLIQHGSSFDDMNSDAGPLWEGDSLPHVKRVEINYTVYMPRDIQLRIDNKFGDIILPNLSGKLKVKNSYGNLTAANLSNSLNEISIDHGDATFKSLSNCTLTVVNGSLDLASCAQTNAVIKYSSALIGE